MAANYLLVAICVIWCITLIHSKSFLSTNTNGRPGCRSAEEMSTRFWRDNDDPTRYWECVTRYQDGVCRLCDQETLFWDEIRLCIAVSEWVWRETVDPPSPPQIVDQCSPKIETISTATVTAASTSTTKKSTTKKPTTTKTSTTTKKPTTTKTTTIKKPITTKKTTTTKKPTTATTKETVTTKKATTIKETITTKKPTTTKKTTTKKPKGDINSSSDTSNSSGSSK